MAVPWSRSLQRQTNVYPALYFRRREECPQVMLQRNRRESVTYADTAKYRPAGRTIAIDWLVGDIEDVLDAAIELERIRQGVRCVDIDKRVAREGNGVRRIVKPASDIGDAAAKRQLRRYFPGHMGIGGDVRHACKLIARRKIDRGQVGVGKSAGESIGEGERRFPFQTARP